MITRYFNLYLNAGKSIPLVINANQYDQGESWIFTLYNEHGVKYVPSSGSIIGIKSDGYAIDNAATVNSSGQVVVTETQQMTAAAGKAVFELSIDSGTHGTANFIVMVEPSPVEEAVVSDSDLSLIQEALNAVTPVVIAETVTDWMDDNITQPTTPVVDASLSVQGAAADAKATGEAIASIISGTGLTADIKAALIDCFAHVAWKDTDGDDYRDALYDALYPPVNLSYITCVYSGGSVFVGTTLDDLKSDLVVTAYYSDFTNEEVNNYTLTGSLNVGTNTITVTYGGKTATFTVTVTYKYSWKLTDGDFHIQASSLAWNETHDIYTNTNATQQGRRRAIYIDDGVKPYNTTTNDSTFTVTDPPQYPIPVPPDATGYTCAITPNTQYMAINTFTYSSLNDAYTRQNDSGWQLGSYTKSFNAGEYEYLAIVTKYNSTGTSYPTEPSEITITFTTP